MISRVLYRRRLVHAIEEAQTQVIYVYGPAGYGKTTTARQWSESQNDPIVWIEGQSTRSETELLVSFVEAIVKTFPELEVKLREFSSTRNFDSEYIADLFSVISKSKLNIKIIVDNAEVIRQSHNDLARILVSELPRNIKLILLTNTSPRVSFIKEFGLDRFIIIGPEELEFSKEEITLLARQVTPNLLPRDIDEIYRWTGGWPAAVELAFNEIESSENQKEAISSIRNFGKKKFTHVVRRILSNLSETEMKLLTDLALLPIIDAESAIDISEDQDAVRKLTHISQESAFLIQNSFDPPSFTINPIVRSALVEESQTKNDFQEKAENVLNHLIKKGDVKASVRILLEIGSVKRLSEFLRDENVTKSIDLSIQDSIVRSAIQDLRDWLPVTNWLDEYGNIAREILNFYIEILSGEFNSAESHLNSMKDLVNSQDKNVQERWVVDILSMETIICYCRGRIEDAFTTAMKAFEKTIQGKVTRRHHQVTYLQLVLWASVICDDDKKVSQIKQILESDVFISAIKNRNSTLNAMRALVAAQEGRFAETRNLIVSPISRGSGQEYRGFFGNYGVKMAKSMLLLESSDFDSSINILQEAADEALYSQNWVIYVGMIGRLSYIKILNGDKETSLKYIALARECIDKHQLSKELHDSVDIWETRVRYFVKDYDRANELMKRSRTSYLMKAFEAGIQIETNPNKALELTEKIARQNPRHQLTYHLFRAHIFANNPTAQLEEIRKAVELGSNHGYFNHFLTQRSDVLQAYISLAAEYPTAFNERLARAAGEKLNGMMVGDFSGEDSLTKREADILRHLATGLPLKEIAANLNISKNTIKTHLRNLYRKLGADGRKDAVEKGKKLLRV